MSPLSARAALHAQLHAGLVELGLTVPPAALEALLDYVELLARWNATYNLTAVRAPDEMITRHLLDSLAILPYVHGRSLADLGTGPGLPGIPLAIAEPAREVLMVDSNGKKVRFLREAIRSLKLANARALQSRVEDVEGTFECVTARAFASLADMLGWGGHLLAPGGVWLAMKGRVLDEELDGIVIATPSAQHAEQARAALERGLAVFCQKPLARTEREAREVIDAARAHDRLLGVDLSYRKVAGVEQMKGLLANDAIGEPFAAELMFHNAYGPDKPWFYDVASAGGGCVIDLGIHLIDLLLWMLDYPAVERVSSELFCEGSPLRKPIEAVEDYAHAELRLAGGASARLACSWKLSAGCDAVIEASFFGTRGSVRLRNVNGSFYDFRVEHCEGTRTRALSVPARSWGSVTICEWARQLAHDPRFDPDIEHLLEVHRILDAIYGRSV